MDNLHNEALASLRPAGAPTGEGMKQTDYHFRQYLVRGRWFWKLRVGGKVIAGGRDAQRVARILAQVLRQEKV